MKPLTTHVEFSLNNAAHFVAARGRTPSTRTRLPPRSTRSFLKGI